jgi:hypothetical protein
MARPCLPPSCGVGLARSREPDMDLHSAKVFQRDLDLNLTRSLRRL